MKQLISFPDRGLGTRLGNNLFSSVYRTLHVLAYKSNSFSLTRQMLRVSKQQTLILVICLSWHTDSFSNMQNLFV